MRALLDVLLVVINLYVYVIIASAIFSWLVAFNVVNQRNQFVGAVLQFLYSVTEPLLRPIRRVVPTVGALDLSPIVLLLGLFLLERIILLYIYPNVF